MDDNYTKLYKYFLDLLIAVKMVVVDNKEPLVNVSISKQGFFESGIFLEVVHKSHPL